MPHEKTYCTAARHQAEEGILTIDVMSCTNKNIYSYHHLAVNGNGRNRRPCSGFRGCNYSSTDQMSFHQHFIRPSYAPSTTRLNSTTRVSSTSTYSLQMTVLFYFTRNQWFFCWKWFSSFPLIVHTQEWHLVTEDPRSRGHGVCTLSTPIDRCYGTLVNVLG